jgi:hypothetical protein
MRTIWHDFNRFIGQCKLGITLMVPLRPKDFGATYKSDYMNMGGYGLLSNVKSDWLLVFGEAGQTLEFLPKKFVVFDPCTALGNHVYNVCGLNEDTELVFTFISSRTKQWMTEHVRGCGLELPNSSEPDIQDYVWG